MNKKMEKIRADSAAVMMIGWMNGYHMLLPDHIPSPWIDLFALMAATFIYFYRAAAASDRNCESEARGSTTSFHKHVKPESKMLRTVICLCLNRWASNANVNSRRASGHVAHVNSEHSDWRAISEIRVLRKAKHRKVVKLYIFYMRCCRERNAWNADDRKFPSRSTLFSAVFHFLHASSEISSEKCVSEKVKMKRRRTKSCRTTMFREKWKRWMVGNRYKLDSAPASGVIEWAASWIKANSIGLWVDSSASERAPKMKNCRIWDGRWFIMRFCWIIDDQNSCSLEKCVENFVLFGEKAGLASTTIFGGF